MKAFRGFHEVCDKEINEIFSSILKNYRTIGNIDMTGNISNEFIRNKNMVFHIPPYQYFGRLYTN